MIAAGETAVLGRKIVRMSIVIVLLCVFIPLMAGAGMVMGRRLAEANRRRIEEYRASRESHILNLRD